MQEAIQRGVRVLFNPITAWTLLCGTAIVAPILWVINPPPPIKIVETARIPVPYKGIDQRLARVFSPSGQVIGWWNIDYPETLPPTGSKPLTITYTHDKQAWDKLPQLPEKLSARFKAPDLTVLPEPLALNVDVKQMAQSHLDGQDRTWALSAPANARTGEEYTLIVAFEIDPPTFRTETIALNGVKQIGPNGVTIPLPFNKPLQVEIRDRISWRNMMWGIWREVIAGAAFILSLPAFAEVIRFLLGRIGKRDGNSPVRQE